MKQATMKRSEWGWGRKALAVVMALVLAVPINTGSVVSGVAEAAESRESVAADGWTLSAKWAKSADATNLAWKSDKDETKVVRLEIGYSREGVDKTYAPGELSIEVPGIGDAVRGRVAAATDVAADAAGARELSYDWSYTWDKASDTYTFTNNNQIDAGETVSGSFELLWALKSRETVNLYSKTLYAEMSNAGSVVASTADVKFSYESAKDVYTASLATAALGSSDGLGADYRDFIWVKYRFSSARELKSCGMTDARWEVELPAGAKVADVRNANDTAMSYSEKDGIVTIPMKTNLSMWYSNYQPQITVGFPREAYNGAETAVSAKLVGTYADRTQPEVAAQAESRFVMNADDYDFDYEGDMFGTDKTHSYNAKIIYGNMMSEDGADFTYYVTAFARCAEGDNATVEIVDDFHDALLNNGQMRQLGHEEYSYKTVTIPSSLYWKNGNGQAAEAGKYTARVLADAGEGFSEVQSVGIDGSSHAVKLPEGTTRVKVAVDNVNSVLNVTNLALAVNYHPVQEGGMNAPESIAPEGSIRSTVGLIVSKDGEVVNAVDRDSYTGTYADVVADRDMNTYGAYVQRGWDDAPITPSGLWRSYTEVTDSGYTADKAGYYNKITVSSRTTNSTGEKPWAEKIVQVLLLPQGMHANLEAEDPTFSTNACTLESGTSPSSSYVADRASIDVERNWKGSGRDLVRVTYDFRSYFASIDQKRAMGRLEGKMLRLCRNEEEVLSARRVLWLTRQFVCEEERGLGLGNQTSQIVAVEYASPIDHMICEVLRLGLSGRYMDDGYVFCPDGVAAREALGAIEAKAISLGLALHPRKCGIEPVRRAHVFLKYRYEIDNGSGEVRLAPVAETLRRYRKRHLRLCRLAAVGEIGMDAVEASEASFRSVVKLATDREGLEAEMARTFGTNRCLAGLNNFARK